MGRGSWDRPLGSLGFETPTQSGEFGKGELDVNRGQICRGPQGPRHHLLLLHRGQMLDVLRREAGERRLWDSGRLGVDRKIKSHLVLYQAEDVLGIHCLSVTSPRKAMTVI